MKWCSTSLTIRERHIKTTVRSHYKSIRMAWIKKKKSARKDMEPHVSLVGMQGVIAI